MATAQRVLRSQMALGGRNVDELSSTGDVTGGEDLPVGGAQRVVDLDEAVAVDFRDIPYGVAAEGGATSAVWASTGNSCSHDSRTR